MDKTKKKQRLLQNILPQDGRKTNVPTHYNFSTPLARSHLSYFKVIKEIIKETEAAMIHATGIASEWVDF